MKLNEIDKQLTTDDLEALETFADRIFAKVGIDVEFTRHFLDRVNDERNGRQITASELTRLFKQEYKKWGKPIAKMGPDAEAVMKDLQTDINMPFVLSWDKENEELDLIAKTVMRKPDFKTSNREFAVEDKDYNLIAQRKTMNLSNQAIIALVASLYKQLDDKELNEWNWRRPLDFPRPDVIGSKVSRDSKYDDTKTIQLPIGLFKGKLNASKKSKKNEEETVNEFTLTDVKDMIKKGWFARPTEKQWKELIQTYNKYKGNVTRKDLINLGIETLGRKESVNEYDLADTRQKRIAIDTVRNPSKALLGGPSVDEAESILKTKFGYSDKQIAKLKESVKEKQEKTDDLLKGFDPKTARALMMLKAKYPQADNILSALLADVENNEKDGDVVDMSQDYKMEKLSKAVDILQKEINLLKRDKTQNARNTPKESVLKEESGIFKFNKEDPNNPEVHIQGYGRLLLNQIEDDLVRNFNSLEHMAKRKDWDNINYQLNNGVMQAKLEAIISTKEELQAIRRKGGPKSRGITKESLYDILIGKDKEMVGLDESFEKLSRKFQVAKNKKAYERAAKVLHTMLQRKYKENEGHWRHALGWYVAKIASGFDGVKTRVLEDYYLENYESAFIESVTEAGGVGKVVPGINTTVDVGPDEIKKQAAKFGNDVDKDGVPKKNLR